MFSIIDLVPEDDEHTRQAASVLVAAFHRWPGVYDSIDGAIDEVRESFGPGRISRIALNVDSNVIGWIGGISAYDGTAWELHPLAIHPDWQRQGVGRALVADLEAQVRERGGLTVYLGTDDQFGWTSLGNTDLYPDVWQHIANISNVADHPFTFYRACGYSIVGVIPDANGIGKPDILMAKRVAGDDR